VKLNPPRNQGGTIRAPDYDPTTGFYQCLYCARPFRDQKGRVLFEGTLGFKFCSDKCRLRKRRRDSPEQKSEQNRRWRERVKADPIRYAEHLANKEAYKVRRARPPKPRPTTKRVLRKAAFIAVREFLREPPEVVVVTRKRRAYRLMSLALPSYIPITIHDQVGRRVLAACGDRVLRRGLDRDRKCEKRKRQDRRERAANEKLFRNVARRAYPEKRRGAYNRSEKRQTAARRARQKRKVEMEAAYIAAIAEGLITPAQEQKQNDES
jgi:hypothetical protein